MQLKLANRDIRAPPYNDFHGCKVKEKSIDLTTIYYKDLLHD